MLLLGRSGCLTRKRHCTGRGKGTPEPGPLDERLAGMIGDSLLGGVVTDAEGHTDGT